MIDCFDKTVKAPNKGALTKEEVIALIADLKWSETSKTLCGRRLIALYETLR